MAPLFRSGSLLNLKAEKVSEISLMDSLKEVVDEMSDRVDGIVDFTCCESVTLEGLDLVGGEYLVPDRGVCDHIP